MGVSISMGNTKMGAIQSVSLPSILTCRKDCDCSKICYARKIERLRPAVARAYQNNLEILTNDPSRYWREVEASIMTSRFFRYHVSGDIPDTKYLERIVLLGRKHKHCEELIFTKKYELVNEWMRMHGYSIDDLPRNLHIVYSVWRGLKCPNPYGFPEAHVRYKDGFTTASMDAHECGGNCTECATMDSGCWVLKPGEQIVFNQH